MFLRGMEKLVEFINSDRCKNIAFLTGAGISVSAGIPDFRSAGGMYDTLKPELLTATEEQRRKMRLDPTHVVSSQLFFQNQLCYLELRRPFILGTAEEKWKATPSHWFIKLIESKGKLLRLFTQNIDGLDYQLNLPDDKIVPVHGSLRKIKCENCKAKYPSSEFREKVKTNIKDIYNLPGEIAPAESTPIECLACGRPCVKPSTVLYGGAMPQRFFELVFDADGDSSQIDLLFVVGTSLTVSPANMVVRCVPESCKRVIVNNQLVGEDLGISIDNDRDFFLEGSCDDSILRLVESLGWSDEFRAICPHPI